MVDAAASLQGKQQFFGQPSAVTSTAAMPAVKVFSAKGADAQAGLAAYAALAGSGLHSPAQSPIWISNWIAKVQPDYLIATLQRGGQPALAIALEVVRSGPFRVARFMGGRHANGNFPAMTQAFAASATAADIKDLTEAIGRARPDIDMIALERLASDIGGVSNPLLGLQHVPSPNVSLAIDLAGGFDAMLGRTSGKRKRKKHRSQTRKFEAVGTFRRITAGSESEVNALLDAFFAMKEVRFQKMGIANVFAEPEVKSFFRSIFAEALKEQKPSFVLNALEVAGKIRAVTGSSLCGDRLICEFGAISEDDLAGASPGEFLFFDNIQQACQDGFAVYDFSVGDEPYKRLWCDLEIRQFDVLAPLTAKGRLLGASMQQVTALKAFIKNNRFIWKLAKTFRKKAAAQVAPSED